MWIGRQKHLLKYPPNWQHPKKRIDGKRIQPIEAGKKSNLVFISLFKNYFMKKLLLIILIAFGLQPGKAQVITQSDFPFLGDIWVEYIDNLPSGFSVSPSGFGQVWDFSTLYNVNDTGGFLFNAPSAVPNNWDQYFPGAHYSFFLQDTDSTCLFFKNTVSGFFLDGIASNDDSLSPNGLNYFDYQPDFMFFPAPFQYGDTLVHNARYILHDTISGYPVLFSFTLKQEFYGEGAGSLTTPLWNYPAVLRMKTFTTSFDSTFIDSNDGNGYILSSDNGPYDTTITYQFLKDGPWMLVATMDEDPASGDIIRASYYQSYLINNLEEKGNTSLQIFPNPVNQNETLQFNSDEVGQLVFVDVSGKVALQTNLRKGVNILSMQGISAGIYHYQFFGQEKNIANGKIIVTK